MTSRKAIDIEDAFKRGTPIDEALNQAVRHAVLAHKRAGAPLVVRRDGRVQLVPAEEIEAEPAPTPPNSESPE